MDLGTWAGLCKTDADGNTRAACKCSCVAVLKVDEEWDAYRQLSNMIAEQKAS
jgi:hypothetical protein